ncbi:MAG: Hpt domain-containing protein [Lachnospiraceae bacterium]|nr:Hpt domain-containing protein [Lachnospiraceae bacterium]
MKLNLRERYEAFGGDYDSVINRLREDARIIKYLIKFMDYHYDKLIKDTLEAKDYETAFREAHNLKGVCANLSIDKLGASASELTEALRGGNPKEDISELVEAVKHDYDMTIEALKGLESEA